MARRKRWRKSKAEHEPLTKFMEQDAVEVLEERVFDGVVKKHSEFNGFPFEKSKEKEVTVAEDEGACEDVVKEECKAIGTNSTA
jgi:hypothetical protein